MNQEEDNAIKFLNQVCCSAKLNIEEHRKWQNALQVVVNAIGEKDKLLKGMKDKPKKKTDSKNNK